MYYTYVVTLGAAPRIALVQVEDDRTTTIMDALSLPLGNSTYEDIMYGLTQMSSKHQSAERNLAIINTLSAVTVNPTTESYKDLTELQERSMYQAISLGEHTRYFVYGAKQTVYSATVPDSELTLITAKYEQAGWHVFYYSTLNAIMSPMLFRGLDGFIELTNQAVLTIFTPTSFKQYMPPIQLLDALQFGAQALKVNTPAELLDLYAEIGSVRAPRYSELLQEAMVDAEDYYAFVASFEEMLSPLATIIDRALSQKPKLQLVAIGELADTPLTREERYQAFGAITPCQCPAKIKFAPEIEYKLFANQFADLLIAVNGCTNNLVNFSTALPILTKVDQKSAATPVEKSRMPKLAVSLKQQDSGMERPVPVATIPISEIPMESISHTQITLATEPLPTDEVHLRLSQVRATPQTDTTAALQTGLQVRQFNLGASLLVIGLVLFLVGTIGRLGLQDSTRLTPIAEQITTMEGQQGKLSTQLEARLNATRLTENTFLQFIPYIEYIGGITDENVTVTDFNLIGDQSLRISGTGSNTDNFRKFKSGLESISVNMNVLLVDSEQTASDQTFTFEVTAKEVQNGAK